MGQWPPNHILVSHVKHKSKPFVYGAVLDTEDGLVFHQWKWPKSVPLTPTTKIPRSTEVKITSKPVTDAIWDSFDRISLKEFCEIEGLDMVRS